MHSVGIVTYFSVTLVILFNRADAQCQSGPPEVQHAAHNVTGSPPFTDGHAASYQCEANYNRVGGGSISTCTGATWSSVSLQCAIKECPAVNPPKNGRISNSPNYTVGTTMEFECNAGYNLSGERSLLCRVDEQWNPRTLPTCDPVDCGEFGTIANTEAPFQDTVSVERNHYGATVRVRCLDGYVLNGPAQVTCQADGQWSTKPTCDISTCPPYPGLQSSCVKDTMLLDIVLYITCAGGSTRTGPTSADCENNNWTDETMACYCNCSLGAVQNSSVQITFVGLNSDGSLNHNGVLQWSCPDGYTKRYTETVSCVDGSLMVNGVALNITTGSATDLCAPVPSSSPATTTPSIDITTNQQMVNESSSQTSAATQQTTQSTGGKTSITPQQTTNQSTNEQTTNTVHQTTNQSRQEQTTITPLQTTNHSTNEQTTITPLQTTNQSTHEQTTNTLQQTTNQSTWEKTTTSSHPTTNQNTTMQHLTHGNQETRAPNANENIGNGAICQTPYRILITCPLLALYISNVFSSKIADNRNICVF